MDDWNDKVVGKIIDDMSHTIQCAILLFKVRDVVTTDRISGDSENMRQRWLSRDHVPVPVLRGVRT